MSCNSCSNVTLPGVPGPAGAPGANGTNGTGITSISWTSNSNSDPQGTPGTTDTYTISYSNGTTSTFVVANGDNGLDGVDGVPVLFMDTTGHNTASNNATSAGVNVIRTDKIDGGTIGTVGDFIKIKGEVIADYADNYVANIRVKFGGNDMFVWYVGISSGGTGLRFEVDLVVSDTNEIRPHVSFTQYKTGVRLSQTLFSEVGGGGGVIATSTAAITLTSDQDIVVEIDSDGVNTTTLTYYEVTKYLKV